MQQIVHNWLQVHPDYQAVFMRSTDLECHRLDTPGLDWSIS